MRFPNAVSQSGFPKAALFSTHAQPAKTSTTALGRVPFASLDFSKFDADLPEFLTSSFGVA